MDKPKPLTPVERQALRDLLRSPGWEIVRRHMDRRCAIQADTALGAEDMATVKRARGYVDGLRDLATWAERESVEKQADDKRKENPETS